jgi:hypothetical protein
MLFVCGGIALHRRVRVAQWIARLPPKQKVAGSNPASDVEAIILHHERI